MGLQELLKPSMEEVKDEEMPDALASSKPALSPDAQGEHIAP
jgi:hypothetical protein